MKLAESIFAEENQDNKAKSEATWFQQMAEAADLPFDEDDMIMQPAKSNKPKAALRAALHHMLQEPLRPIGAKRKFRQLHEEINNNLISTDGEYRSRDATVDLTTKSKRHSLKRFRKR